MQKGRWGKSEVVYTEQFLLLIVVVCDKRIVSVKAVAENRYEAWGPEQELGWP